MAARLMIGVVPINVGGALMLNQSRHRIQNVDQLERVFFTQVDAPEPDPVPGDAAHQLASGETVFIHVNSAHPLWAWTLRGESPLIVSEEPEL